MSNEVAEATISSTDPNNYGEIQVNLEYSSQVQYINLNVSALTTTASFIVLDKEDYFKVDDTTYNITDEYVELTTASLIEILNEFNEDIQFDVDNTQRFVISFTDDVQSFSCSYRLAMNLGLYHQNYEDITITSNKIQGLSNPLHLFTPILYLTSNLGATNRVSQPDQRSTQSLARSATPSSSNKRIAMRINNSFTAGYPIVHMSSEFGSMIPINNLCDLKFQLTDANYVPIKLLTPMYLSLNISDVVP